MEIPRRQYHSSFIDKNRKKQSSHCLILNRHKNLKSLWFTGFPHRVNIPKSKRHVTILSTKICLQSIGGHSVAARKLSFALFLSLNTCSSISLKEPFLIKSSCAYLYVYFVFRFKLI